MRICVFCAASEALPARCYEVAAELGRWIARNGHTLVFGGTAMGMMEAVARAAKDGGALVEGIVPRRVEDGGRLSELLDIHLPCEDLTDRKTLMMERSDAFVALPGGIGTLDELFTVAASASLAYHSKPLVLLDVDGFWHPLVAMLDALTLSRAISAGKWQRLIKVAGSVEEAAQLIDCRR